MGRIEINFRQETIEDNATTADSLKAEFEILEARLLGRANDLSGSFDSAGEQFTDIIGWGIKFRGEEDEQAWMDAATNIRYLVGVTAKWANCIRRFKREESAIYADWREERSAKENALPDKYQFVDASTPERSLTDWDANRARNRYEELKDVRTELLERAQENMNSYKTEVEELSAMFREGPTEVHVNSLIESGHATWGFANINPGTYLEQDHDLSQENAEDLAVEMGGYWSGDKPLDDRYYELMLYMGMLSTHAMYAQQGGAAMDPEEMEFLEAFYDKLEEETEGGVIGYPETLEGDHLTDDERAAALGIVGDGLLIISDERLGGGYDSLPASVRSVAEGSDLTSVSNDNDLGQAQRDWVPGAEALELMFNHSNKRLEGGAELSTTLMHTVSSEIGNFSLPGYKTEDSALDGLLNAATRNEDANYAILTGDYPDDLKDQLDEVPDLPWSSYTDNAADDAAAEAIADSMRSKIIENIYTHDWPDDGDAARGLTAWIEGDAWSDDEDKREMAAEAMIGLMETTTTKEMHEALSGTGNTVELDNGESLKNAPFGAVNPEIADGFAHLFELYIDSFASEDGLAHGTVDFDWDGTPAWNDDARTFNIAPADRLIFLEYVMGDEDAAVRAHTAADVYSATQTELYIEEGPDNSRRATNASNAQFLVDSALNHELINRGLNADEQSAAEQKIAERVAGVGSGALGLVPGLGFPLSEASDIISSELINTAFENQQAMTPHTSSHTSETLIEYQTSLRALEAILKENGGVLPELKADQLTDEELAEENRDPMPQEVLRDAGILTGSEHLGHGVTHPSSEPEDGPTPAETLSVIEAYLRADDASTLPGENLSHSADFSKAYWDTFNQNYRSLEGPLRYDETTIERLYERNEA